MLRGLDNTGEKANFTITTNEDYGKTLIYLWKYKNSTVADSEPTTPIKYGRNQIKFSLYFQEE
jgi:hypothetical protein